MFIVIQLAKEKKSIKFKPVTTIPRKGSRTIIDT